SYREQGYPCRFISPAWITPRHLESDEFTRSSEELKSARLALVEPGSRSQAVAGAGNCPFGNSVVFIDTISADTYRAQQGVRTAVVDRLSARKCDNAVMIRASSIITTETSARKRSI